jgi:FKBP-type peptidyl-prolyl cis-trans isomerase
MKTLIPDGSDEAASDAIFSAVNVHLPEPPVMKRAALLVLAMTLCACGNQQQRTDGATAEQQVANETGLRDIDFAPALNIEWSRMSHTPEGVFYEDLREGSGRSAVAGATVTVEYKAWLPDGTLFEERPNEEGFGASSFVLGVSPPVPGLGAGLEGMRTGGVRRIVVPPEHGYGLVGRPAGVPPRSPLVFEVRLVGVS